MQNKDRYLYSADLKNIIKSNLKNMGIQRLLFYLSNLIIFFLFNLHNIMLLRPQSVHQWRQCDSASYCLNYFQNDSNFFFPQVMALWGYKGYVISEFPVLYWVTGKLYKIFGYHEAIARLVTYSVFLIGLVFLFELCLKLFKNKWFAFLPVLVLYSSPFMVYYALNFLPNIPAFGLMLASWFFFFKYLDNRKFNYFVLCSLFSLLSALLKPVEIFNYSIMFGLLCFEYFRWFGLSRFSYSKKEIRNIIIVFCGVVYGTYIWINYAQGYADSFGYHGNLLGFLPIWKMTDFQIMDTFKIITVKWSHQLFWPPAYFFLLFLFFGVIVFYKRVNRYLFLAIILTFLAQIVYIVLFFDTFYHHDYYMINIFIVPILIVIGSLQIWESFEISKPINISALVFLIGFLFMTLKHSSYIIHNRYYGFLQEGLNPHLQTITPYLRSIGITKEDIVISVPDASPNISLYLMNQKGWTNIFVWDPSNITHFIGQGAKYIIVNGPISQHPDWYEPYMKNLIGEYQGIKIYETNVERERRIKEYTTKILNTPEWLADLTKKAKASDVPLDSLIKKNAVYMVETEIVNKMGREEKVKEYTAKILNTPEWLEGLTKKAKASGVSLDSLIKQNAIYMAETEK